MNPMTYLRRWVSVFVVSVLLVGFGVSSVQGASPLLNIDDGEIEQGPEPFRFSHRAMGTEFAFTVYPREGDVGMEDVGPIVREAFQAIDALEQRISSWIASSNTSEINRSASTGLVGAVPEVWNLLTFSQEVWAETDGAFDVTVGPIIDYRKKKDSERVGRDILGRVGMDKVVLDTNARTVAFTLPGMRVGFGGIGKGLALDVAADILQLHGVESALLSGGDSSIVVLGSPPGRDFWQIGIHNPYNVDSDVKTLLLRDQALSTSACFHEVPGALDKEPCGIFDPQTGETVGGMLSTTVVATTGMATDALSTAFYVMGVERSKGYCARHPDVGAVMVPLPEDDAPQAVLIGNIQVKP